MQIDGSKLTGQWKKVGSEKRFGVSIPLYALHSKTTYGIGEFLELVKLFPWLQSIGFTVVQLQPLYDTGGMPNPYLPYSPFAFNPLFLSLTEIPHSSNREELYLQKAISYSSAAKFKEALLVKFYYDHGETVFKSDAFHAFCEGNSWLDDYVGLKGRDPKFHQFVQFLCHQQLKQVKSEAEKHGILLIHEMPSRLQAEGPDVKYHPNWFSINEHEASCNWAEMKKEDYSWWKERLTHSANYFDGGKLDQAIEDDHFFAEISQDQLFMIILNESQSPHSSHVNLCPVATYPNSENYPSRSLTTLARPNSHISCEQRKQLIKSAHSTNSLLHVIPLTSYISLIPKLNWTAATEEDIDKWCLSIKPSIEELVSDTKLSKIMQECIDF